MTELAHVPWGLLSIDSYWQDRTFSFLTWVGTNDYVKWADVAQNLATQVQEEIRNKGD